jgi:hypothetical protein
LRGCAADPGPDACRCSQSAAGVKVKDVPAFLAGKLTRENISSNTAVLLADYKKAHIDTGSFTPMKHVLIGVFGLAYTVAWPQEYKHWKHEQEVKHGGGGKH